MGGHNSGTRFKVFEIAASPGTVEEKIADAATVHRLAGVRPVPSLGTDLRRAVDRRKVWINGSRGETMPEAADNKNDAVSRWERPTIVDAQWHEPGPWLDWTDGSEDTCDKLFAESILASMDSVGVDRALLFPTLRHEPWATWMSHQWPDKFLMVPCFNYLTGGESEVVLDAGAPDVEDTLVKLTSDPAVRAVRFVITARETNLHMFESGAWHQGFQACEQLRIPAFLFISGRLDLVTPLTDRYPDLSLVIDHMGMKQPSLEEVDSPPWKSLPQLLSLARHPNVYVKVSGVPSLSTERFPFRDCWRPVRSIVDTFGPDRLMWGADIARFRGRNGWHFRATEEERNYVGQHTYAESVTLFRDTALLSDEEKEWMLAGTVRQLLRW